MARLSHLLITLPLMAVPILVLGLKPAAAEEVTPLGALELLAKSKAAEAKCKTLPGNDRDELGGYLARAEVATSSRYTVEESKAAISWGRQTGENAACGPETASEIEATLSAAREAMADVNARREPEPRKRAVARTPPVRASSRQTFAEPGSGGLKRYGHQALAYYLDRRCQHLSSREARDFWRKVVAQYSSAVNLYGAGPVARVQQRAEAQAGAFGCSERSEQLVEQAYVEVRRL